MKRAAFSIAIVALLGASAAGGTATSLAENPVCDKVNSTQQSLGHEVFYCGGYIDPWGPPEHAKNEVNCDLRQLGFNTPCH